MCGVAQINHIMEHRAGREWSAHLHSGGHDSLLVEDGAGPRHVVVLPPHPRRSGQPEPGQSFQI